MRGFYVPLKRVGDGYTVDDGTTVAVLGVVVHNVLGGNWHFPKEKLGQVMEQIAAMGIEVRL